MNQARKKFKTNDFPCSKTLKVLQNATKIKVNLEELYNKVNLFVCVWESTLHIHKTAHHVCAVPTETKRGRQISRNLSYIWF